MIKTRLRALIVVCSMLFGLLVGISVGARNIPSAHAQQCDWCMGVEYCCPSRLNPVGCANLGCKNYGANNTKVCSFYGVENGADCTAITDCETCPT